MTYPSRIGLSSILIVLTAVGIYGSITGCNQTNTSVVPSPPQVLVENGAWTWFNDERSIFAGAHLYIGFVDTAGYSGVTVYPLETNEDVQTYRLGSFQEKDDHNNPAFVQVEEGSILAAYAPHDTQPFWYWRFAENTESDAIHWLPEQKTEHLDAHTTYSNLIQLAGEDGRLYNFFRGTNFDPVVMISDDDGHTWGAVQHVIASGGPETRPYVKYASNGLDRIDMLFTQAHPRDAKTNIYHVYYRNGTLYQSNGTRIQPLPGDDVPPMPVEEGTLIYRADEQGRAWVWDLEYGADSAPVAVYVTARDSTTGNDLRYHYARWDEQDGRWHEQEVAYAGTHLYDGENHYAGGITLDPADPHTVYVSSDVHPATSDSTAHYQVYRGTTRDDGATWTWTVLTRPKIISGLLCHGVGRNTTPYYGFAVTIPPTRTTRQTSSACLTKLTTLFCGRWHYLGRTVLPAFGG